MPEARSISWAAWAPVIPRKVRTLEYFLNADFVRQLAHSDRARAGRMKRKYVGSICMNMVLLPFRVRITGTAYVVFLRETQPAQLAELVHARRLENLRSGGLGSLGIGLQGDLHGLDASRHLLGAQLHGLARPGGEDAAAHRALIRHEAELVGLALRGRRDIVETEVPVLVVGGDEEHAAGRRLKRIGCRWAHGAGLDGGRGDQREFLPHAQGVLDGARDPAAFQVELVAESVDRVPLLAELHVEHA